MTSATAGRLPLPAVSTVRATAAFVQARTEEAAQALLQRFPAEQREHRDAVELLRVPRALGQAAEEAAYQLEGELLSDRPNEDAARLLWQTLLNTARPFQGHPELPQGAGRALTARTESTARRTVLRQDLLERLLHLELARVDPLTATQWRVIVHRVRGMSIDANWISNLSGLLAWGIEDDADGGALPDLGVDWKQLATAVRAWTRIQTLAVMEAIHEDNIGALPTRPEQ